jgi:hypothetical protein
VKTNLNCSIFKSEGNKNKNKIFYILYKFPLFGPQWVGWGGVGSTGGLKLISEIAYSNKK